ncbi:hypothetical protein ACFOVU_04395 [Nocardiopsis sediminis]|uniref:DUF3558 domain-containing protein n=1 Tax=Nocardiopsis sediminis TaxID=1778267 RepID=A0ABV8FJQ5_9ACTN
MPGTSGRVWFNRGRIGLTTAAAAAVALVAAGCGGGSEGAGGGDTPTLEAMYSEVVPAAQAPAPEGFSEVEVEGVKINAPEDWNIDNTDGYVCMRPPDQGNDCEYGSIQVLPHAAERHDNRWPKRGNAFNDAEAGWASAPGECRSAATAEGGTAVTGAEITSPPNDLTEHADGLKSHHRVWEVTCENGDTFEVRLWFLPESDVAVYVWSADTRYSALYDEVAASMDISDYKK